MKGAASFEAFGWRQYARVGARYSVRRSIQVWGSYSTRSTRAKRLWERSFERRRPSAFQRIRSNRLFRPESFVSPVASRPSNRGPRSIQMRCFQCYTLFARSCSSRVSRKMFPKMFCKCFRTVLIRPNGLIIANSGRLFAETAQCVAKSAENFKSFEEARQSFRGHFCAQIFLVED